MEPPTLSAAQEPLMQNHFIASAFAVALLVPACGGGARVQPAKTEVGIEHRVLVHVLRVDGDTFKFSVVNLSDQPMLVDRDAVTLSTPTGTRRREPGGLASSYTIPPSGAHDVFVKFDLSELESGNQVAVDFAKAIRIAGEPVPVDVIPFTIP
jgi:hypothetical protein